MINKIILDVLSGHTQINMVFEGDPFLLNGRVDVKYPLSILDLNNSVINTGSRTSVFRIYVCDRVFIDQSNVIDIQQDCLETITDIVKYLAYNYNYTISTPINCTPFKVLLADDVAGYYLDLELIEPMSSNPCESPLTLLGNSHIIVNDNTIYIIDQILEKNIEQDNRLNIIESGQTIQDNRLNIIESGQTIQDNRLNTIENVNTILEHNDYNSIYLQSENSGGTLNNDVYNFWNFTPKSIYDALNKILTYIFNRKDEDSFYTRRLNETFNGVIKLDKDITQYNNYTLTGNTNISIDPQSVMEGTAEGVLIGDGNSLLTLTGINYWATSPEFDKTLNKQNHFMVWKQGDGVYIFITQKN